MRNVHMMHMSPFRDAIFMMQMSHAGVRMQSLSMMVPAHIFNRDANVSLQRCRCKMSCGANALQRVCYDADVPLGVCRNANVPLVGMP